MELIGAFESTYLPAHDIDVIELSGHDVRWRDDLNLLAALGIRRLRYPIRWHRVEGEPGVYDWRSTDTVMDYLDEHGFAPAIDLVHHTSYPRWLTRGFADKRFPDAYLRFAEAVAERYPWIPEYTLFNEPFATLFLCGHEAIWPPYGQRLESLVGLFENVLPALSEVSQMYRDMLPKARHLYVDTCEGHTAATEECAEFVAMVNDRRFFVLDAMLGPERGRPLGEDRPFVRAVVEAGGESLLNSLKPGHIDTLGLDYYAHSEWRFSRSGGQKPSPKPFGLANLILQYAERYRGLPLALTETNIRGYASDRASWLKYAVEQCEAAVARGANLRGFCWFPLIDSLDWDSLLARPARHIDPVGVYWLDRDLNRNMSSMSRSYAMLARGARAADLPAYEFRMPVYEQLAGFRDQMRHWDWQQPPAREVGDGWSSYDALRRRHDERAEAS